MLTIACSLVACQFNDGEDTDNDLPTTVKSIKIDESTIPEELYVGEYSDIFDMKLLVTYSDDTFKYVPVTDEMLTDESKNKLSTVGTHLLALVYEGKEYRFSVPVYNKQAESFSLKIYGGLPTMVNGKELVGIGETSPGYYENVYKKGDVVTIVWTSDGYYFDYWTKNGAKSSTASIIEITMDNDYTFRAYTKAMVNTVSFVTFTNTAISSKNTDVLNERDIDTITKDNYVFVGWTTDEIDEEQAYSGYSENLVTFPFSVTRSTVFYAVWTPVGLEYQDVDGGVKVVNYNGDVAELYIPKTIEGKDVIAVSSNAFLKENVRSLCKIHISSSIRQIEEGAFRNCVRLVEFNVNDESESYKSIDGILYSKDLSNIVCYPQAKLLTEYEINANVERVSAYAFCNASVGGILLGSKVNVINEKAFDSVHVNHVDFTKVSPVGLTINGDIFNKELAQILIDEATSGSFCLQFMQIDEVSNKIITDANLLSKIELVSRVESDGFASQLMFRIIKNDNFVNKGNVAELIAIDRKIKNSTLPISTTLGYDFVSIAAGAYKDCYELTNVTIPISTKLERVCDDAFVDTPYLDTLGNNSIAANNVLYKYLGNEKVYELDVKTKKIAEGAFNSNEELEYVNIGDNTSLSAIMAYAFADCESFVGFICPANPSGEGVYVKSALTHIGAYAFYNTLIPELKLQAQTDISINALSNIGEFAFAQCKYLKSVELGANTVFVSDDAFYGDPSIERFVLRSQNEKFVVYDGILYAKGNSEYTLFNYPAAKIDGVFNPGVVNNYADSLVIDESAYLRDNSLSVGKIYFNGLGYDLYMSVSISTALLEVDKTGKKLVNFTTGKYPTETTDYTVTNGDIVANGEKYYYFINKSNKKVVVLYSEEYGNYYYEENLNVTKLGRYSLQESNIGALYVPSSVAIIEDEAVSIPGLVYVEYQSEPISTYLNMFSKYEPQYVIITIGAINAYFSNNVQKMNEKLLLDASIKPEFQFGYSDGKIDRNILYSTAEGVISVARTSRNKQEITIPENVVFDVAGELNAINSAKYVRSYAFYGYYLQKTTLQNVAGLESYAFSEAVNMTQLLLETAFISNVKSNTFGKKLNNGLYIYDYVSDVNLYMNTSEWGLEFFEFKDINGDSSYASKYLIQSEDGAFAVIVYDDGENETTIAMPYGIIASNDIEEMSNNVSLEGYDIAGFVDDLGNEISTDRDYQIPYNQIIECKWTPQTYTIYLVAPSTIVLDLEISSVEEVSGTTTYKTQVTFNEEYEFTIKSNLTDRELCWRDHNGEVFVLNSGVWNVEVDGSLTLFSAYGYKVNLILNDDLAEIETNSVTLYENKDYVLPVPTSSSKFFVGWAYDDENDQIMLTDALGNSILPWAYTAKAEYDIYAVWSDSNE